jgi:hypothetical protein
MVVSRRYIWSDQILAGGEVRGKKILALDTVLARVI